MPNVTCLKFSQFISNTPFFLTCPLLLHWFEIVPTASIPTLCFLYCLQTSLPSSLPLRCWNYATIHSVNYHSLKSLPLLVHRELLSSSLNLFLRNLSHHLALNSMRIKSYILFLYCLMQKLSWSRTHPILNLQGSCMNLHFPTRRMYVIHITYVYYNVPVPSHQLKSWCYRQIESVLSYSYSNVLRNYSIPVWV